VCHELLDWMTHPHRVCAANHGGWLHADGIPKGDVSKSPGLRGTRYPGYRSAQVPTPTGLRLFTMPQSLSSVYLHVIFSTKDRFPFLADKSVRNETHAMLGGIAKRLNCSPIQVGGIADHVHLLIQLDRGISQAEMVKELKRASNYWIHERFPELQKFSWQAGYGTFSVSVSNLESVRHYVEGQEEHHRKVSFQDEFRTFLKKHELAFDERYVWD
jgi:REP element-mobilizing transposase RayT